MTDRVDIRVMSAADVSLAVDWAAAEGWNPGLADAALFRAADPRGFLMAFDGGEPVAAISVVAYDNAFGFLGFYMVRPDRRGRGLGLKLWNAGMDRLGGRTVGLDGVVGQQANYRRSGFAFAHRNVRFSGIPAVNPGADDDGVRPFQPSDLRALAAYDRRHVPAGREVFLAGWLTAAGHRILLAERQGRLAGYGVVRRCRQGFKIAPLFADDARIAESLFRALVRSCGAGDEITIDVPEPNGVAVAMAATHGLTAVFETARMYRGPAPDLPLDAIFGITSFELG